MGILIDSSVLVAVERGALALSETLAQAGDEPVALSAITASELLHGVHRAKGSEVRTRRESFIERLLKDDELHAFALRLSQFLRCEALRAKVLAKIHAADCSASSVQCVTGKLSEGESEAII